MYFYLVTVSYDGSNFAGWAKQPKQFTVQGWIETILSKTFCQKINILATSRTDKGVHALNQKFTLRLNFPFSAKKLKLIINKTLKEYVVVKNVKKITKDFHPIRNVVNKEYRYFINIGEYNLFNKKYRWEYNLPLRVRKLNNILTLFKGEHDFFNFSFCRLKDKEKFTTVRIIELIKVQKKRELLMIRIKARNFLRYQIRAIIGESVNCYEGKQNISDLKEKLNNFENPSNKYKLLAPASGLYLWRIKHRK